MKQQKKSWVKTLLSFAEPCKGKMILSVLCAIFSVAGGFIPFWAVYKILLLFINRTATGNDILLWCLVGVGGYLIRVLCFGISTILAHISAYTILEGIRLKIANRLMKAPLGEVMRRRIGYLKNIIMDKVEDLEPPLAHMIPELTSNLLLPVAIFTWMICKHTGGPASLPYHRRRCPGRAGCGKHGDPPLFRLHSSAFHQDKL